MASEPKRDPITDPLLTPQNAALLVIDYQPSQIAAVSSIDRTQITRGRTSSSGRQSRRPVADAVDIVLTSRLSQGL